MKLSKNNIILRCSFILSANKKLRNILIRERIENHFNYYRRSTDADNGHLELLKWARANQCQRAHFPDLEFLTCVV